MPLDSLTVFLGLARFAHYASLTLLFGGLLFPYYAYGRAPPERQAREPSRDRRGGLGLIVATSLALLSGVGWFLFTTASMAGSLSAAWDGSILWQALVETDFGRLWIGRTAALACLVLVLPMRSPAARTSALAASAAALGSLAWTGHAEDGEGLLGAVHKLADVAHLLTAGLWVGALPALAAQLRRRSSAATGDAASTFRVVSRFSGVAAVAVALLALSGGANAALIMSSPRDMVTTVYGRLLCLKLAMVAIMLGLAFVNRQWLTPALRNDGSAEAVRILRRHCLLELALGLGVLAVVAVLGTTSPG